MMQNLLHSYYFWIFAASLSSSITTAIILHIFYRRAMIKYSDECSAIFRESFGESFREKFSESFSKEFIKLYQPVLEKEYLDFGNRIIDNYTESLKNGGIFESVDELIKSARVVENTISGLISESISSAKVTLH